jgi:hypothetical protein
VKRCPLFAAYGKSKHSQDTDRASTRAEAINQKGTFGHGSALAQGQDRTIDQALPRAGSSLAECVASSCGRHPAALFPPELRTFFTRVGSARLPPSSHNPQTMADKSPCLLGSRRRRRRLKLRELCRAGQEASSGKPGTRPLLTSDLSPITSHFSRLPSLAGQAGFDR